MDPQKYCKFQNKAATGCRQTFIFSKSELHIASKNGGVLEFASTGQESHEGKEEGKEANVNKNLFELSSHEHLKKHNGAVATNWVSRDWFSKLH